jgi:UPF0755 protein
MKQQMIRTYIVVVGSVCFALVFLYSVFAAPPSLVHELRVQIDPGSGISDIATVLMKEGVIRSAGFFKFYAFLSGAAHRLKPGIYSFPRATNIASVTERLVEGPVPISFLIQEGRSLSDIEADLVTFGLLGQGELTGIAPQNFIERYPFLKDKTSLEGFLFPDTYQIIPGTVPHDIVAQFLDNFTKKAEPFLSRGAKEQSKNEYRTLIIASLLEREVASDVDRKLVAGIIERRLSIGMPLQIDASVSYATCAGHFDGCLLTKESFALKSPYNTYINRGLPVTPITNPGIDAIRAALAPRSSSYLYYLTDPATGKTFISETFEDHRAKQARYLH